MKNQVLDEFLVIYEIFHREIFLADILAPFLLLIHPIIQFLKPVVLWPFPSSFFFNFIEFLLNSNNKVHFTASNYLFYFQV